MTILGREPHPEHANHSDRTWKMAREYPHTCVNCGEDYNHHNPWLELPCPVDALIRTGVLSESIRHMN